MIGIEGEWEGLDGMGLAALEELRPRAEATVERVAKKFHKEIQVTLSGNRSGRTYLVPGSDTTTYVASAPGEPPARPTGRLAGSFTWTAPAWEGWTVSSEVGTNVEYAKRMEYGGSHVTRKPATFMIEPGKWVTVKAGTLIVTAARPYLAPTMLRMEPIADRMFEEGL